MTKHYSLLALLAAACLVFSCKEPIVDEPTPEPEPEAPVLTIQPELEISGKEGQYSVAYTLENPVEGVSLVPETSCDWMFGAKTAIGEILFNAANNLGEPRFSTLKVSYGDITRGVTVTQKTFEFDSFAFEVSDITQIGAKIVFKPKTYKGNYFFEVFSKASVDKFTSLDVNSVGDKGYAEALYQDDLAYLQGLASKNGLSLAQALEKIPNMYKVTSDGAAAEMVYNDLKSGVDYYAIVYGMDLDGKRTTEVCLYQFTTAVPDESALTFTGMASNISQNSARITINPSNQTDTYYWTYASERDLALYSPDTIMKNMIANIKASASQYGVPISTFLDTGSVNMEVKEFVMGTAYTIFAWGMDASGNPTTYAQEVCSFRTKANEVTDNCKFTLEIKEIESMDVKVKITPSNASTRYYVAFIDEKRCNAYTDYMMVQRIINMEADRLEKDFYGEGLTWDTLPGMMTGENEVWARRDLLWSFEPEHSYRIYIFGLNSSGNVTTEILRSDVTTKAAEPSNVTFKVSLNSDSNWHIGAFDITPSNSTDYFMPFLVKTSDVDLFRYADGSLMERELMDQIRDIYEDEISQYVYKGQKTFYATWSSDSEYSLILFGYAGSNTTPLYEFKFKSPAIPFGKADCDISYTYELFNGDDLAAMNPAIWGGSKGDCVMKVNIAVTGNPANYYFGLWPPKENFASTGGIDHLLILCQNEGTTGDNIINKKFGVLKPWWNGAGMGDGFFTTDEGEVLEHMPWSITAYAEDENHNYSPLHYEIFIPVKKPASLVTGKYEVGYQEPYDFWTAPSSDPHVKTMIFNVPKPEITK